MKMKKKITILLIILAVIVAGIAIYFAQKPNEPETIKIGAILPLTGELSYLGEEEKNILRLAEEEINSKNEEPKVKIIIEDSKSTSKDGVSAYHKLRLEKIDGMVISLTIIAESVKPLYEKDNILTAVLSIHPEITKDTKNTLRIYYGLEDEMKLMADFLKYKNAKKVAALYIDTPEDRIGIEKYFKSYLAKNGIEYLGSETYTFSDKSVRSQLLKLKSLNPDFIMTIDFGYMYPTILKEAEALGIREKILGGLGMMTAPKMSNNLTKDIYFAAGGFVISPTSKFIEFANKYKQRFGKDLTFDGVYTYDAFYILFNVLKIKQRKKENFLNKTFEGISGKIFIDEEGKAKVDIKIGQYDDKGNIHPVNW
jgi:branched-chain amino acid transport system substrate-binding protein